MGKMNATVFYSLRSTWHRITSFHTLLVTQPHAGTVWGTLHRCVNTRKGAVIGALLEATFHKVYA